MTIAAIRCALFPVAVATWWNPGHPTSIALSGGAAKLVCLPPRGYPPTTMGGSPLAVICRSALLLLLLLLVTPAGYARGNILLLSMLGGPSLFGLVICVLAGSLWPYVIPSAAGMALQVINFPTGKPMQPHAPGFIGHGPQ